MGNFTPLNLGRCGKWPSLVGTTGLMQMDVDPQLRHSLFETLCKEQHQHSMGMIMGMIMGKLFNSPQLGLLSIPEFATSQACLHLFFFFFPVLFNFGCVSSFFEGIFRIEGPGCTRVSPSPRQHFFAQLFRHGRRSCRSPTKVWQAMEWH